MTAIKVNNTWVKYWELKSDTREAVHKTGLAVAFDGKYAMTANRIIGISGLDALSGTEWAGLAPALVEQAVTLWQTR
jgi:hypothetical protein